MTILTTSIDVLLEQLTECLDKNTPLASELYDAISQKPEYGIDVMSLLPKTESSSDDTEDTASLEPSPQLMASLHFIEICLVQVKLAQEQFQRWADELLTRYQTTLLSLIEQYPDNACWLAVINLFFDAELTVTEEIKEKYLEVMSQSQGDDEAQEHQQVIVEQLLSDNSDATDFEIAELFLSQTNALPQDYFPSFLKELLTFNMPKATNSAILFLLHPTMEIRDTIIQHAGAIFEDIILPGESMSRLLMIRHWLPEVEKGAIELLINEQRKKSAPFADLRQAEIREIHATEMDGTGAQAIFLLVKRKKGFQAAGLLVKRYYGIKDTWLSPIMSKAEAKNYAKDSVYGDFFVKKIDQNYLDTLIADHIHQAQKIDAVPHLNLLELQEITGSQWQAQPIQIEQTIEQLLVEHPVIDAAYQKKSFARSDNWYRKYKFTESWYDESPELDRLVNQFCTFVDGIKQCHVSNALPTIIEQYFEARREQWLEHFLWLALWAKPSARHNEYLWKDALVVTCALFNNQPMMELPIIRVIAEHSILQSVETMENRKTHLGSIRPY
tara:strand:- start:5 stop:1672 length:1668 start_codon:yes stop_codon:yes gene_type:complete